MTKEEMQLATRELVETLPVEPTWEDLMYRVYVRQKIEAGLSDSEADRVISVEEVRAHFRAKQ